MYRPRRSGESRNPGWQACVYLLASSRLVWYEVHDTIESAIVREKAIKEWKRGWKIQLLEISNPEWRDLYEELG